MDSEGASIPSVPSDHGFKYSPLKAKEFRLIKSISTRPAPSKQVAISLYHVYLAESPRFVLISSTWGRQSSESTALLCNGSRLEVTPKVASIVRTLHNDSAYRDKLYWLDAICVNQDDSWERSEQLKLMPSIFVRAELTLGWTGIEISPSTYTFLKRLAAITPEEPVLQRHPGHSSIFQNNHRITATNLTSHESEYMKVVRDLTGVRPTASVLGPDTAMRPKHIRRYLSLTLQARGFQRDHILSDFNETDAFLEIRNLCDAEYFGRMSILPDFVLSSRLILRCGSVEIPWRTFCTALQVMTLSGVHMRLKSWQIENILVADALREQHRFDRLSLADALLAVQGCSYVTADPRDRLYALLAIKNFEPNVEQLLLTDYSKDVGSILASLCEYITERQGPTFLALAGVSQAKNGTDTPQLASWVPDLTLPKRRLLLAHPNSHFSASTKRCPPDMVHNDELRCYVTTIDTVAEVAEYLAPRRICDQYDITGDNTYAFLGWLKLARLTENSSTAYGSDALLTRFAETIHAKGCNQIWEHWDLGDYASLASKTRAFFQYLEDPAIVPTADLRIFNAACLPSHDRRFGLTENERFCLLPQATLRGDIICTIRGFKVPVVLRKSGYQYTNVGECYVHGMMHGAADGTESYITIT